MRAQEANLCAPSTHIQAPNACIFIAQECIPLHASRMRASSLRKSAYMRVPGTHVSSLRGRMYLPCAYAHIERTVTRASIMIGSTLFQETGHFFSPVLSPRSGKNGKNVEALR